MSMNLDGLENDVLLFSDPVWSGQDTIPSTIIRNLSALLSDLTYSDHTYENLTVLASKYSATDNGVLQGLLYVPDLPKGDPCYEYERDYVPDSAVRQSDLPPTNYNLIALAPWFNANCTRSYFSSARVDPIRAFLVYVPGNDSARPPGKDSDAWDLHDSGKWRTENHYPIFAISGALGADMMKWLSLYSGNVSEVPYGENISALYDPDPSDYVRIWTQLNVSTPSGLPNVWVLLLATLGVVLLVIASTILSRRCIWRRRRMSLKNRVMAGEVNLEAMNIKRLTVPISHIRSFPLFTYNYEPPEPPTPTSTVALGSSRSTLNGPPSPTYSTPPTFPVPQRKSLRSQIRLESLDATLTAAAFADNGETLSPTMSVHSPSAVGNGYDKQNITSASPISSYDDNAPREVTPAVGKLDYQPACQICLQEFEHRVTIIRELACGHIFHPDCIDEYLSTMSSLCPLCKTSMLPTNFSPKITNAMARRERAIRRLRERVTTGDSDLESTPGRIHSWGSSVKKHLHNPVFCTMTQRDTDGPTADAFVVELERTLPSNTPTNGQPVANVSEATRRRMHQLARTGAEEEERPTRWKTLLTKFIELA